MKIKKVNRYYCEFCKKSGCSAYHICKHEKSCTMNPNRVCRMCEKMRNGKHDLNVLKALLPDPKEYFIIYAWTNMEDFTDGEQAINPYFQEDLKKAMAILKRESEDCPMCILAALKQRGIPCWIANYNYPKELNSIWECMREDND